MADAASQQLVVFSLAGEYYAVAISAVSEIIRYTPPRSILSDEPGIQGVISLRGKIVPVFDLAAQLNLAGAASPGKIIILETNAGHVGVIVDDVDEVHHVTADQIEDIPNAAHGTIAKLDDRLVIVLEPEQVVATSPEQVLL